MVTLEEAFDAAQDRLSAAGGIDPDEGVKLAGFYEENVRRLSTGFDFDAEDLLRVSERNTQAVLAMMLITRAPLDLVLNGIFAQAFMTGVYFQKMAQEEAAE